jgi:CheY-like chemotaxis protein
MSVQDRSTKHVLIAEDDDAIRDTLEDLLSAAGYHVIAAEDGLEALDWLSSVPVDLVIVDILMPRLGGPELINHIRQTNQLAAVPIILVSGFADLDRYRDLPVDAIYHKPFHLPDLVEEVQRLIGPSE